MDDKRIITRYYKQKNVALYLQQNYTSLFFKINSFNWEYKAVRTI